MLTVQQLKKACKENKFILVRFPSGYQMGVNCKLLPLALRRTDRENHSYTQFISYRACNFMEYISKKHPFKTI